MVRTVETLPQLFLAGFNSSSGSRLVVAQPAPTVTFVVADTPPPTVTADAASLGR